MKNPWNELPNNPSYVIPPDLRAVNAFNDRCRNNDYRIQTHILPEPFIGNVNAPIYLLSLNPGFDEKDPLWHADERFNSSIRLNLLHEKKSFPFYFLNPQYVQSPGAQWWLRKLKRLISDTNLEIVANNLFCVEYFPYHSRRYKEMPARIAAMFLRSQQYNMFLVQEAIKRNTNIIIMRSSRKWFQAIPELQGKNNVFTLHNPQNVCITPNNLKNYSNIVALLRRKVSVIEK